GTERYEANVGGARPQQAPEAQRTSAVLSLFQARRDVSDPYNVAIRVRAEGLQREQRLRIDTGAGQVFWLEAAMSSGENVLTAVYNKLGAYSIACDLIDGEGFRLVTLGETSVEITDDEPEQMAPQQGMAGASSAAIPAEVALDINVPIVVNPTEPWLPFRYARPNFAWTRTYRQPGGYVSRSLSPGAYIAIREQVASGGQIWYQTGAFDWIPASSVALVTPSELRGVILDGSANPPTPPPVQPPTEPPVAPPSGERKGTVIAGVLNVRARPGTSNDNPPIESLRYGAPVTVFEESVVAGVRWYRIGVNRWVHAGYVRLNSAPGASDLPPAPSDATPVGAPAPLRVDSVGDRLSREPRASGPGLPFGWVVSPTLNVRKTPGLTGQLLGELTHYQVVPILEEIVRDRQRWYRIGQDQWTSATWVSVARPHARPGNIRPDERWVGVNLKEQTAIAYEGDKPVFAGLIASGVAGSPTVQGIFRTWWRLDSRRMAGPGYYLEEVTWTCYVSGGYALHTAYWHDNFGRPRSHGCVNFSPYDAWWIFQWSAASGANAPTVYTYWG
ncbi:MAG: L,D-transpeptidase family protein, partial [Caldilineaceae bacterium]